MSNHRYILEPLLDLELDKNRFRVKYCPCNKSNKDGKFVPFKKYDNKGYCHSCGLWFNVAAADCKSCKTENAFSRYIDTENTNNYLSNEVGKCLYCAYHYTTKQYFQDNNISFDTTKQQQQRQRKPEFSETIKKAASLIPVDVFKQSLKGHMENCFVKFLLALFGHQITCKLISMYFIGTSKHWQGANVFWQIDVNGKVRTGKIMLYNPNTGKRIKEPYNHISWVHKSLQLPEYNLQQCFFGEHLLREPAKHIAVVESEKTAVIASVYLPQFIWIAAGSKDGLNVDKCKILKGRTVTFFPDLNGFDKWSSKAKELSPFAHISISDLLERKATIEERVQGLDLADYLTRFDYKIFNNQQPEPILRTNILINNILTTPCETVLPADWGSYRMLFVRTAAGDYDVLFGLDGKPVQVKTDTVRRIEAFFNKHFQPAFIDEVQCLANAVKNG